MNELVSSAVVSAGPASSLGCGTGSLKVLVEETWFSFLLTLALAMEFVLWWDLF